MPSQHLWAYERGTFWAMDFDRAAPPVSAPRTAATLGEVTPDAAGAIASAMGLADPCQAQQRFAAGSRCFVARIEDAIAAYGWVSRGVEEIGELECSLRMRPDEAYIWDCATLAPFRRRGLYSALLAFTAQCLREDGVRRIWIGASVRNLPSLRGFAAAGFQPVANVFHVRLLTVSRTWLMREATTPPALAAALRQALGGAREGAGQAAPEG